LQLAGGDRAVGATGETALVDDLRALAADAHAALGALERRFRDVGDLTSRDAWPDAATEEAIRAALVEVARVREAANALKAGGPGGAERRTAAR
jgi:hypothetical protein